MLTRSPPRDVASSPATVGATEFEELCLALSNWGRWGPEDDRGAINHLTRARVLSAAKLVREGVSVSLSLPLNTEPAIDNPKPADHYMTELDPRDTRASSLRFLKGYVGVDYHNDGHTHIDALSHIAYEGQMYNARPDDAATSKGVKMNTIEVLKYGLIGRGVLLDIPRLRQVPWLEPGVHVCSDDLQAAEDRQGVKVKPGDILLVRTGHTQRLAELGPWNTTEAKAVHPAMPLNTR